MKTKIMKKLMMFLSVVLGFLLISQQESVTDAVRNGLTVCGDILIPSLFPFMALSSFALSSGVFDTDSKFIRFIMKRVFSLPAVCFPAVLFGFTGGYPVGARVISSLYEDGKISARDAKHLFAFCVNAGPAFTVSAVGGMILGSKTAGYIMLVSVCFSSLVTGAVYARVKKEKECIYIENNKNISAGDGIVSAVSSAGAGILSVCSWVLVFSAVSSIVRAFIGNETLALVYDSVSEVTSGLSSAVKLGGIPFASACISFGGVCIMCQLLPYIKKCGMKISEYLLFRIINSVLSFFTAKLILLFTDVPVSVYSDMAPALHFAPASASLMMMCAVLIFSVSSVSRQPCPS